MNVCTDCEKKISRGATRCKKCVAVAKWGPESYCINCSKEITKGFLRCRKCYNMSREKPKNFCLDCGKEVWQPKSRCEICSGRARRKYSESNCCKDCSKEIGRHAIRCNKCSAVESGRRKRILPRHNYCVDCNKEISRNSTRCLSCAAIKKLCTYASPTQPEKDIVDILDKLGIEYFSQYRIGYYLYDVYLPNHNILIEYDGWYWHHSDWAIKHGANKRDERKDVLAKQKGLELIRLSGLPGHDLTYDELQLVLQITLSPRGEL